MTTALIVFGCVAAYILIGSLVYGVTRVRFRFSEEGAGASAFFWPVSWVIFAVLFAVLYACSWLGAFGEWVAKPRPKRNRKVDIPKAKVVAK